MTLTDKEKRIIRRMADKIYTVEFCEEWLSRKPENVFTNAPAALQQSMVEGFVIAVKNIAAGITDEYGDGVYCAVCGGKMDDE